MGFGHPILLTIILLLSGAVLFRLLGREPRAAEGRMVALLLPWLILLSVTAVTAKRGDLFSGARLNLNDPHADAMALSDRADVAPEIADRVLAYRDALPGRAFRSMGQIPSLGRASDREVARLREWAARKHWDPLRQVARTGVLPPASRGVGSSGPTVGNGVSPGAEDRLDRRTEGSDETAATGFGPPAAGHGLYPILDLRIRAARLLPDPPFTLDRSSRAELTAALRNPVVVRRIIQSRAMENHRHESLSDVTAVPLETVALRSPAAALRHFEVTIGLLLFLLLAGHLWQRKHRPDADPFLWPIFGGLSALGVVMLFAVAPPLTARGNVWPYLGSVPEYAGQGWSLALAMLLLPAGKRILLWSEIIGSRWVAGSLAAIILLPNVLARAGWVAVPILLAVPVAAACLAVVAARRRETGASPERMAIDGATPPSRSTSRGSGDGSVKPAAGSRPPAPTGPEQKAVIIDGEPWKVDPGGSSRVPARLGSRSYGFPVPKRWLPAISLLLLAVALTAARIIAGRIGYAPLVEMSKVLLVLYTARLCSDYELFLGGGFGDLPTRTRWEWIGCWAAAMVLAFLANDLGFLLLLWIPFTLLLSLSIGRAWPVAIGIAGLVAGALVLSLTGQSRFPDRLAAWLHPWDAPSTQMAEAFQRMASVPSVLSGMGIGQGSRITVSTDTRDVILPLYYEQIGWVGVSLVVLLFLLGIHRIFRIGLSARRSHAHWTALGFGCIYGVQTVYMIGVGFGAWPLTGMTLAPLASGKAAAFFTMLMAVFVLSISTDMGPIAAGERRRRARFLGWTFAVLAAMTLYGMGKLARNVVVDRDKAALRAIDGLRNRRITATLASFRAGRILARRNGPGFENANLTGLAGNRREEDGSTRRVYPYGEAMLPVTGAMDSRHRIGGEEEWRGRLTGLDDTIDYLTDRSMRPISEDQLALEFWRRRRHPLRPRDVKITPGNVRTTVVAGMQERAYRTLRRHLASTLDRSGSRPRQGALLIADARTGEVLVFAQYPSADPSRLTRDWEGWDDLQRSPAALLDRNGALIDRIRGTNRAPGSTAKIVTMMALSEAGEANRVFSCRSGIRVNGREIREHNDAVHGQVGLEEILKVSCNRGASQAAHAIGPNELLEQYRRLRYRLPGMPRPEQAFRDYYQQIAFGQVIGASLWEVATGVAAVARGGEAIELHLLRSKPEMVEKWRVCSPETAARVARGMTAASEPGGTAWAAYRGRHDWPSKTGSAEVAGGRDTDAWFTGYAPRIDPAFVFVAWVEEGGAGGAMARSIGLPGLIESCLADFGIRDRYASVARERARPSPSTESEFDPEEFVYRILRSPELRERFRFLERLPERIDEARRRWERWR